MLILNARVIMSSPSSNPATITAAGRGPVPRWAYLSPHRKAQPNRRLLNASSARRKFHLIATTYLFSNSYRKTTLELICFHTLIKYALCNYPVFIHLCFTPPYPPNPSAPLPYPVSPSRSPAATGKKRDCLPLSLGRSHRARPFRMRTMTPQHFKTSAECKQ